MTNKNYYSANLLDVMKKVSEYWKIIFLCGIISGAIGFVVFNYFISPIYEANAIVIVNTRLDNSIAVTNDEIASAENLVDTYAVIIQSRTVLDAVIEKLNLSSKIVLEAIEFLYTKKMVFWDRQKELVLSVVDI